MKRAPTTAPPSAITPADYADGVRLAYVIMGAIRSTDFGGMLAAINRAEALGPITNPSLFKAKNQVMREDKSVIAILARAKAELAALPWPAEDDTIAMRARERLPFDPPGHPPFSVEEADSDATGDASRVLAGGAL
jgi:hypothetical protein